MSENAAKTFDILIWSSIGTCSLLIPVQSYTFYKVWTGRRYSKVVSLVIMLYISNVSWLIWAIAFLKADEN